MLQAAGQDVIHETRSTARLPHLQFGGAQALLVLQDKLAVRSRPCPLQAASVVSLQRSASHGPPKTQSASSTSAARPRSVWRLVSRHVLQQKHNVY